MESVADIVTKYLQGADGHTDHERLFGKLMYGEGLELGKRVLWRKHRSNDMNVVLDARWAEGVWRGRRWNTTHHRVAVNHEVLDVHAVPRRHTRSIDGVGGLWNAFERLRGKLGATLSCPLLQPRATKATAPILWICPTGLHGEAKAGLNARREGSLFALVKIPLRGDRVRLRLRRATNQSRSRGVERHPREAGGSSSQRCETFSELDAAADRSATRDGEISAPSVGWVSVEPDRIAGLGADRQQRVLSSVGRCGWTSIIQKEMAKKTACV